MAEWRVGRGWTEAELETRLGALDGMGRNFEGSEAERAADPTWEAHGSRSVLATVGPDRAASRELFDRGRRALELYAFSDPAIVEAHFSPGVPLEGRRMLLELKVPLLRYLCGVVVSEVLDTHEDGLRRFGFRYDTLEGHIERGSEWFLLEQDRDGEVLRLRIEATWRRGDFPNWWSRLGFDLVGRRYQRRWHQRAHERMAAMVRGTAPAAPVRGRRLAHEGPRVVFTHGPQEIQDGSS